MAHRRTGLAVVALALAVAHAAAQKDPAPPLARTLPNQLKGVFHVAYRPDGKHLAVPWKDGTVHVYDAATGGEVRALTGHKGRVYTTAYSPDGKRLATAGLDKTVRLWDMDKGELIHTLQGPHTSDVYAVQFSPDGRFVASGGMDKKVCLWDAASGKLLHAVPAHSGRVYAVAFAPDGLTLVTTCGTNDSNAAGGEVRVWQVPTMAELYALPLSDNAGAMNLAFSRNGRRLAGVCLNGSVKVWEMATAQECLVLKGHTAQGYGVSFSPDGRRLASVCGDWNKDTLPGEVRVWELPAGKALASYPAHAMTTWAVAFAPDGRHLATACGKFNKDDAGEVKLWDVSGLTASPAPPAPTPAQLDQLWAALAERDAKAAYPAVVALADGATQSVPFLLDKAACPPPGTRARVPQLIKDLDSDSYRTREQASAELERLGPLAYPALQEALEKSKSAEVRRRAKQLLEHKSVAAALSSEELRGVRVVEAMEMARGPEARKVLEKLAGGPKESPVAAAAARALGRSPR